jgi:NitT/TauT family transport system substrate-binding protein
METSLLDFGHARIRQLGLVTGGDAARQGILSMTDARWKQTFDFMAGAGLAKADTDYRKAYTLEPMQDIRVLP